MGVVRARNLAIATMANIRQNLFFAIVYNAAGVPIAAGILYPFFGIMLSPMLAAAAMSLSSVCVISNALRLRKIRLQWFPLSFSLRRAFCRLLALNLAINGSSATLTSSKLQFYFSARLSSRR